MKAIDYQDLPKELQREIEQNDSDGQRIWFVRKDGKKGYSEPYRIENDFHQMVAANMFLKGYRLVYFQRREDSETPWLRKGVQPATPESTPMPMIPPDLPEHFDELPSEPALSISWEHHYNPAQPEYIPPQLDPPQQVTVVYDERYDDWRDKATGHWSGLRSFYAPDEELRSQLTQLAQEYDAHIARLRAIGQEWDEALQQKKVYLKRPSEKKEEQSTT